MLGIVHFHEKTRQSKVAFFLIQLEITKKSRVKISRKEAFKIFLSNIFRNIEICILQRKDLSHKFMEGKSLLHACHTCLRSLWFLDCELAGFLSKPTTIHSASFDDIQWLSSFLNLSVLIQIVRYNNVKDPKMSECFVTFCGGNYKKCVCYSSSYGSPWIVNVYL